MRYLMKTGLLLGMLFFTNAYTFSAIETHEFANDLERQRYQSFVEEMRCPKCQNQNLAGSDSPISADLRRELYEMIKQGKSDKEIVDFMVARYGDFILYRPRVEPTTYLLWAAPGLLLLIGIIVVIVMLRQRRRMVLIESTNDLSLEENNRLSILLNNHHSSSEEERS